MAGFATGAPVVAAAGFKVAAGVAGFDVLDGSGFAVGTSISIAEAELDAVADRGGAFPVVNGIGSALFVGSAGNGSTLFIGASAGGGSSGTVTATLGVDAGPTLADSFGCPLTINTTATPTAATTQIAAPKAGHIVRAFRGPARSGSTLVVALAMDGPVLSTDDCASIAGIGIAGAIGAAIAATGAWRFTSTWVAATVSTVHAASCGATAGGAAGSSVGEVADAAGICA